MTGYVLHTDKRDASARFSTPDTRGEPLAAEGQSRGTHSPTTPPHRTHGLHDRLGRCAGVPAHHHPVMGNRIQAATGPTQTELRRHVCRDSPTPPRITHHSPPLVPGDRLGPPQGPSSVTVLTTGTQGPYNDGSLSVIGTSFRNAERM